MTDSRLRTIVRTLCHAASAKSNGFFDKSTKNAEYVHTAYLRSIIAWYSSVEDADDLTSLWDHGENPETEDV